MKDCKKCRVPFSSTAKIEGKLTAVNLQNRKYCLSCSPYGLHNTRRIETPFRTRNQRMVDDAKIRRVRVKAKMVDYCGGKCKSCGYSRCAAALEFHHRDPIDKEFPLSVAYRFSWERIKKELDKCDLLCANCHAEHHESQISVR